MSEENPGDSTQPDEDRLLAELEARFGDEAEVGDKTDRLVITPEFRVWVDGLPLPSPQEIVDELRGLGYRGQDRATRAVALAAHRHMRRVKAIYVDGVPRRELPSKQNLLLIGPTGCGKTYLAEMLFEQILKVPATTVDITAYSETGYIGEDTSSLVTRLLYAADGDVLKTCVGVICLDEFDKLASSSNRAVFAGQGTTKDVSGFGVQRELLKMFDGAKLTVPTEFSHDTMQSRPLVPTHDIAFVACGAFSGLKSITNARARLGIGFTGGEGPEFGDEEIAVVYDQSELENVLHFQEYGFLPELIGRFTRIVPFQPLGPRTLREILDRNVLVEYRREFTHAGIELEIEETVLDRVVHEAMEKETGARGLRSRVTLHLEEAAFEAFSAPNQGRSIVLRLDGDEVVSQVR